MLTSYTLSIYSDNILFIKSLKGQISHQYIIYKMYHKEQRESQTTDQILPPNLHAYLQFPKLKKNNVWI